MNKPSFPSLYHHPWANEVTRSGHEWSDTDDVVRSVFQSVTPFHIHPPLPCQSVTLGLTVCPLRSFSLHTTAYDPRSVPTLTLLPCSLHVTHLSRSKRPSHSHSLFLYRSLRSRHEGTEGSGRKESGMGRVTRTWVTSREWTRDR